MSSYFRCALDLSRRKVVIDEAVSRLSTVTFDAIAFTGMSGAVVAPVIAYLLNKSVIAIRKKEQQSHSGIGAISLGYDLPLEFRYIFLDDCTDSCNTLHFVRQRVSEVVPSAIFVGIYLYNDSRFNQQHTRRVGIPHFNRILDFDSYS